MTAIAVLGLGKMGSAVARVLAAGGYAVTGWNRTALPDGSRDGQQRLRIVDTLNDALTCSTHIISVLPDTPVTQRVLGGASRSALNGRLLVQFASTSPPEAREMQSWAGVNGLRYLAASILSYPADLGSEKSTIIVSGERQHFEEAQGWIARFGHVQYVGEDAGLASAMEQSMLTYSYYEIGGFLQGAALAAKSGLPLTLYFQTLKRLGYGHEAVEYYGQRIIDRDYSETGATVTTHRAALRGVLRSAMAHDIDCSGLSSIDRQMERLIQRGHGDDDIAALFETM